MNINDDYILRLTESVGKFAAKILFHKEPEEMESIALDSISRENIIPILVKRLTYDGKYNEAENIIFEELNKNPSEEIYDIAKMFYNTLLAKSDQELEKANFSREEVYLGLSDVERIIFKKE